jgi:hypothetical protein
MTNMTTMTHHVDIETLQNFHPRLIMGSFLIASRKKNQPSRGPTRRS